MTMGPPCAEETKKKSFNILRCPGAQPDNQKPYPCRARTFREHPFWPVFHHFRHLPTPVEPHSSPGGANVLCQSAIRLLRGARGNLQKWERSPQHRDLALSRGLTFFSLSTTILLERWEDTPFMSVSHPERLGRSSGSCLTQSLAIVKLWPQCRGRNHRRR